MPKCLSKLKKKTIEDAIQGGNRVTKANAIMNVCDIPALKGSLTVVRFAIKIISAQKTMSKVDMFVWLGKPIKKNCNVTRPIKRLRR